MVNTELRDRIRKNSTLDEVAILSDSFLFKDRPTVVTPVPMINVALSGRVDKGMLPGLLQIAGESRHFKTAFGLLLISSFLKQYPDGVVIFYDSEFGTPKSYFESFGVDPHSVVWSPVTDLEELRFDIVKQLGIITKKDHVMIMIDSIGNLASTKEAQDAVEQKSVSDMSRAKEIKGLFRIIYGKLTMKNIPLVAINHVYKELGLYPATIVSGGSGPKYNSNDIWIIGRQQDKDGSNLTGFNFIINIEKSRTVREKAKIPIAVTFEKGIHKWSGLFDVALAEGVITSEKQGWYKVPNLPKQFRRAELEDNAELWESLFETTDFPERITNRFSLPLNNIIQEDNGEQDNPAELSAE